MAFSDNSSMLSFAFWPEAEFLHDSWGVGIHDLDRNGHLDLYFNHHGGTPGEIIMNFASPEEAHIRYELPGDLHGASFFDIDQDGDLDLLQAQGGREGTAEDPADPAVWNRVYLNDGGALALENSVEDFGIAYELGRKRINTPINLDGKLAIFVGVLNDRPDGSYPGQLFGRQDSGRYVEIDPVGGPLTGEVVQGVHLGEDGFVDLINVDTKAKEFRVYENRGAGFGAETLLSRNATIADYAAGDFDGDLRTDILLARPARREALFLQDADGGWTNVGATATTPFQKNTYSVVDGDFDNDGDLDYAALKVQDGVEVVTYLNRGDGTFTEGSRFLDAAFPGRGEFMFSGDFNRDGWLDLIVSTSAPIPNAAPRPGAYAYLEGGGLAGANWLSVELRGEQSETSGLGARVYVTTPDDAVQVREQDGAVHMTSQNAADLHFGLGGNASADIRIVWADGYEQRLSDVAINRHMVITETRAVGLVLRGSNGADALNGGVGPDEIRGIGGADVLSGMQGDDRLYGGRGADRLFGFAGADVLTGGQGRDRMRGGEQADVFVFEAASDSPVGAGRDSILDFASVDAIDLSAIDARPGAGDQAFTFIAATAFGGVAGQLRFAGGVLQGDVDGDAAADFEIEIVSATLPVAGDLVL